jgi:hypothetical protein
MLIGFVAPQMVLFVAIMAKNKLEGMTWQKLFNAPVNLPIIAFLVPTSLSWLFAIFPTYWAFLGFDEIISGNGLTIFLWIGFIYNLILIYLLTQKFSRIHFQ